MFHLSYRTKSQRHEKPTKEEWEEIARAAYSKKGQRKFRRKKYSDKEQYNFLNKEPTENKEDTLRKDFNSPRNATLYFPNALGVYNILGNAAEMTATKGIAKGAAWTHKADEVTVEKDFS
ncbi:MAG: SUMF1/EgtB/PvdO family nonheme iron enzyme [Salinivirgaceae bacterium]|jgi:formylglycine-generating enzyme required for sulfatase activity|nr:SUMF1/EgtB/PvdO family nonheme iron enzyme [Salinivirgaceae bacterium]